MKQGTKSLRQRLRYGCLPVAKFLKTLILIFCKSLKTFKNLIVWVVLNVFQTLENQIYYLEPLHALHGFTKIMKSGLKILSVERKDQVENDFDLLYQ